MPEQFNHCRAVVYSGVVTVVLAAHMWVVLEHELVVRQDQPRARRAA